MPTLRSIFMLQDNYSRAIDRIYSSTQRATSAIDKASSATDAVNNRFTASEGSANRLTSALTRVGAAFLSLEGMKKAMNISDTYTNISSKLSLITQNAKQLSSLQSQIFAAADRARGSYASMADTVAKLGIIAGEQFGNTNNIVKFTETMQKMFKIGGTSASEQAGAFLQLQQAIGLGRLQGQDLRILSEDAPLVEKAIAQYLGKSTGEIKSLGTQGKITSEVLINSILQYSGTVDKQIGQMKYTWGDYWNKIKNGAYQAFGGAFGEESKLLASQNFKNMINGIISSFYALANVANGVMTGVANVAGFVTDNWSFVAPVIWGIVGAMGAWTAATWAQAGAQAVLNFMEMANPVGLIIIAITVLITVIYLAVAAINKFANQSISATGFITGTVGMLVGTVYNAFAIIWNVIAAVVNFLNHAFQNPIASIETLFIDLATTINSVLLNVAQNIQNMLNGIPGFKVDITSGLTNIQNSLVKGSAAIKSAAGLKDIMPTMQLTTIKSSWDTGYKFGQGIDNSVKGALGKIEKLGNLGKAATNLGSLANPVAVRGTGSNGAIDVNIADQDLQYLRDLAEKQYINKFSTAVLSPKLSVNFTGNAGNKDDQRQIYVTMGRMLREELATAAEGLYP